MKDAHLFYVTFMSTVALCLTASTMYALWNMRGAEHVCSTLDETACTDNSICRWIDSPDTGQTCVYDYNFSMLCAFAVLLTGGVWLALGVHNQDQITKAVACVWRVSYALLLLGLTVFTGAMWIHYKSYTAGLFFAVFFGSTSGVAIGLLVLFLKARLTPPPSLQKDSSDSFTKEAMQSFDCDSSPEEKRP